MATRGTQQATTSAPSELAPYLPRLTVEWMLRTPEARHRAVEGSMAFVDISGFTAMAERLAPMGRLGAEEVTDVMNATFSRLLGLAYEHGGGLVKLGGDAMLLFFDGPDNARRACSAAWSMRDSLRALGALKTSVGDVSLRMHVGIHSGVFDFFLVGNRHRELIIAGPDAASVVAMEEDAEAGEIVVSSTTARHLGLAGPAKGRGSLLVEPPPVTLTGIAEVPDVGALDLLQGVPEALRGHLLARTIESEHRHATVAFLRFGDVAGILATEGPAVACAAIDEVVTALQETAAAHEVCFLESDIDGVGGRVVLVAGAPSTSGDDEERMLRTVRATIDAQTRLPLHAGIATGSVFAGEIGPAYRRAYTILGSTAALAARLMAKADAHSAWTTTEVVSRSKTVFAVTPVGMVPLKGKAEPVEVVAVGPVADAQATAPRKKLALVDRQRELPMLDAFLVPVKMGFGNFVELVGDPGVGKTRIVEELCDRANGLALVSTACDQYEAMTPYYPFRKLLAPLLEIPGDGDIDSISTALTERLAQIDIALTPWAPLVADVLDISVHPTHETQELQPSFRRARLHGVVEAILHSALSTSTLLLFEDVHWMDEASCDLLRHLGTTVTTKPWLVCTTRRPAGGGFVAAEGSPPVAALSLRLDPLPDADAQALAVAAAEEDLTSEEIAAITDRASGNPLFVQELVAAQRRGSQRVDDALPDSVEGVVTARIDSLAPADRTLLRWASVLGATFAGELVAQVLDDDPDAAVDSESWDRLAEFVERDPYVAGTFRFRHALIRDAAYEGLSFRRRRELHARVADVIREASRDHDEDTEALSLHYWLAGRAQEAWQFSLAAARRARAKFANVDAAEFYRRALDAGKMLSSLSRADVGLAWEELGDVLEVSGDYGEAHLAYKEARRLLRGDNAAIAVLCLKEGRLAEYSGKYANALNWFTRGMRVAESSEGRGKSEWLRLSLGYAVTRFRQGAMRDCIERCNNVVEAARASGDHAELAHAYYLLHLAYTSLGSHERISVRDLALPIYEELGDLQGQANALNHLGIDAYYEGRWDDALDFYERSLRARERIGDIVGAATMKNNIAEIYSDQGRIAEAERLFVEARDTYDAAGSAAYSAVATANLGRAAGRAGRHDEARALLETALAALDAAEASSFVAETRARLAELATLASQADLALSAASAAADLDGAATPAVRALLHRARACAHAQRGDVREAERELEQSLVVARDADATYELALSLRLKARLSGDSALAKEAQSLLEDLHVVAVADPPLPAPRATEG